jgi:hypothetical protein
LAVEFQGLHHCSAAMRGGRRWRLPLHERHPEDAAVRK